MEHDQTAYWKKRIRLKFNSVYKQFLLGVKDAEGMAMHAGLDTNDLNPAIDELIESCKKVDKAFANADTTIIVKKPVN